MSNSYTYNESFTKTNAKYLSSKVAADLKRIQRFYGKPSDSLIADYEEELAILLKNDAVRKVAYGFKRDGKWVEPTLIYTAENFSGNNWTDDDPGTVRPGADVEGLSFTSFLSYSGNWNALSSEERLNIKKSLPIKRTSGNEPSINGQVSNDKNYYSGGKSLNRSSVKS